MQNVEFQINEYGGYDFQGFPIGKPVNSIRFTAPFDAVKVYDVSTGWNVSLSNAWHYARTVIGFNRRGGIEQVIV